MRRACVLVRAAALVAVLCSAASATVVETVPIGNAGNFPDTEIMSTDGTTGYGSVRDAYQIGRYEVTARQYTEFLNAVAVTDTHGLYNPEMWSDAVGAKIDQSGSPGTYSYTVAADKGDRPVNFVSWGDSARFANWLHNGQPTGAQGPATTEDGSYFLDGALTRLELLAVTREPDATWVIPSENEWYKAAYHKNDGLTGNYFDYPTSNDAAPGNSLTDPDPGNTATFLDGSFVPGPPNWRSEVGDHENSWSPYGTFDQGGNVWEWNEAVIDLSGGSLDDADRGLRGGDYSNSAGSLISSFRSSYDPSQEELFIGFRVSQVPEPTTLTLLALGSLAFLCRRIGTP